MYILIGVIRKQIKKINKKNPDSPDNITDQQTSIILLSLSRILKHPLYKSSHMEV